jgi:hypothetical protein
MTFCSRHSIAYAHKGFGGKACAESNPGKEGGNPPPPIGDRSIFKAKREATYSRCACVSLTCGISVTACVAHSGA